MFGAVAGCLVLASASWAEEGWTSYTEEPAAPGFTPPAATTERELLADDPTPEVVRGERGQKGDTGPKGDRGDPGPKGDKGDSADLCSNIPGTQTQPGWKIWPQRYWGFMPRREKRVLSMNRKRQLVCVTQRWIRKHTIRRA